MQTPNQAQTRNRKILEYVLPSVGAMFVTYLYVVVDGIFVGQGVGPQALAAVNLAVPYTEVLTAVASMLTIGGATVTAIRMGRGDQKGANASFMTSCFLICTVAMLITLLGVVCPGPLARLLGANEALMQGTIDYIRWYSAFSIFFTLAILMSAYVRNDGEPKLALWGMVAGAVCNVFLDWLFIFPLNMGIRGAAIASGLGQLASCLVLALHFIRRRGMLRVERFVPPPALCGKVFRRGLPEFVIQMSTPVTIFCYNRVVLRLMGGDGLAAFSAISYLFTMMLGIFFGVSQGLQPLIGNAFGEGKRRDVAYYFRAGILINLGLSAVTYGLLLGFGTHVLSLFASDARIIAIAHDSLKVYGLSFLPAAVNIIYTMLFLSTKRTGRSLAVAIARGFVLNTLFIFAFPALFGAGSIWYAMVAAEVLTVVFAAGLKRAAERPVVRRRTGAAAHRLS